MSELTYKAAAEYLEVSPATVKNWSRQGLLSVNSTMNPLESEILQLKEKISAHKSSRLSSRANKSSAQRKFIPTEYIENRVLRKDVNRLASDLDSVETEDSIFLLALSIILIERSGLIDKSAKNGTEIPVICHKGLSDEISSWYYSVNCPPLKELRTWISSINIPLQRDTTGLIYQMLQNEGRKSEKGSYYTPPAYADEVLKLYGATGQRFLDPCCGSGMFLLAAARKYDSPDRIYGWDTDRTAVHLARINLMLYFKDQQFNPHVYYRNCLTAKTEDRFDLIATNPPWGHHFSQKDRTLLKKEYPSIKTGESFSYFIEAGLKLLNRKGKLSYILPEALLKVRTHRDIRKRILDNVQVNYVKYLGTPFNRVQTKVVRIDMSHRKTEQDTTVFRDHQTYTVNCRRFYKNPHYVFDFNCNSRDSEIINNIYSKKDESLKDNTLWIMGIVSGNNKRFISIIKKKGYKPILSGQDISPYKIRKPEHFIYFDRKILQQSAPEEYYGKSPKIVYKFISSKLVFAIDRYGFTTLNSANSFHSSLSTPPEVIIALFNSSLYQFLYKKKFNSLKVLKGNLEQLPIPRLEKDETENLVKIVHKIEHSEHSQFALLQENVDEFIFQYFSISDRDRRYILENL